jgi:membrane protease YdiL (CAAX protease family)
VPYIKRKRSKLSLEEFVVIFFICQGIMTFGAMISNALTSFLSSLLGYTVNNETSDLMMDTPIWIVILIAVIIGPLFEELMFRKIFMDRISAYGDRFAILVSAISFGIFHGNFSQLIYATGLGLVLGYVYSKTRNVMYSFLLHALINFFGSIPVMLISDNLDRVLAVADPSTLPFEEF